MDPLTIGLTLARFVPSVLKLLDKDEHTESKVEQVVGRLSDIALKVTGKENTDEAALALSSNPDLALQYKRMVLEDKTIYERLDEQSRNRASTQYAINSGMSDEIARRVMKWNLIYVLALLAIQVGFMLALQDKPTLIALISNIIGVVIGNLLTERQQVTSFHFGSSLGSKIKEQVRAAFKG